MRCRIWQASRFAVEARGAACFRSLCSQAKAALQSIFWSLPPVPVVGQRYCDDVGTKEGETEMKAVFGGENSKNSTV